MAELQQGPQIKKPSVVAILRAPGFFLVLLGQLCSLLADNIYMIALPWLILQATGSALVLGSVFAAAALPRALLVPVGGVAADRYKPQRLMAAMSFMRALVLAILTIILSRAHVSLIYAMVFLLGSESAFYYPAQNALLPRLVSKEALLTANSLVHGSAQVLGMVGPALGGVIVGAVGGHVSLLVASVVYLISAILIVLVHLQDDVVAVSSPSSFRKDLMDGLRAAWADPPVRGLVLLAAVGNLGFVGPFSVGIPVLVRAQLGGGPETFGTLTAAFSAGALAGTAMAGLAGHLRRGSFVLMAFGLTAVSFGALSSVRGSLLAHAVLVAAGIGSGLGNVMVITLLQLRTPQELLGRVTSLVLLGSLGLTPLSQVGAGVVVELLGLPLVFLLGGGLTLAALAATGRWIRRL